MTYQASVIRLDILHLGWIERMSEGVVCEEHAETYRRRESHSADSAYGGGIRLGWQSLRSP